MDVVEIKYLLNKIAKFFDILAEEKMIMSVYERDIERHAKHIRDIEGLIEDYESDYAGEILATRIGHLLDEIEDKVESIRGEL